MRRLLCLLAASAAVVTGVTPLLATSHSEATAPFAAALADPHRQADRTRDASRHPAETLAFFRIEPGMTVADVMPGSGWYTRVLVPYLGAQGRYIALAPASTKPGAPDFAATFPAKAAGWTGAPAGRIAAYTTTAVPPTLDGTVDRVLIMREVHNLVRAGSMARDLATAHRILKPDGLLGIEEHRAKATAPDRYVDGSNGYMREADVIRTVEAQGFVLLAKSEINANPKDTADYPGGVWTLPPTLSQGETDRAKYQAIGESDRMTLLFRKRR